MRGRRASAATRQRAASPAPPPWLPSPWQAPGDTLLPVLELLLAQEEGTRWLRVASHVCSAWRSMSLEVLLADTAISKPPLEDFRAIGRLQAAAQPPADPAKADTVATQAAVVFEASGSTGVEAMSKPCFDRPPGLQQQPALPGPGLPPGLAAAAQLRMRRTRAAHELQQQHALQRTQAALARLAAAAPAGPTHQRPAQQQQHAAAAAPEAEAPQGSIQSDVAAVGRLAAYASDSDGGSTLAQVPSKRRRRRMRRRGASRGMSVEQPLSPQQAQAQLEQQQAQRGQQVRQQWTQGTGPPSAAARGRKRAASNGEVDGPLTCRQGGAAQDGDVAGPSQAAPAQQAKRTRRGGRSQPAAAPPAEASPASAVQQRRQKVQQQLLEGSEVSGSYAGLDGGAMETDALPAGAAYVAALSGGDAAGGMAAEAAAALQAPAPAAQQRSVGSGPVQAVFGFVRRMVGLGL